MQSSAASPSTFGLPSTFPRASDSNTVNTTGTRWESLKLGKYREILIAVALFLLFDLAVLVLNFYVSFQIAEDAVSINLAGRQRMLSQRMSKALFAADHASMQGAVPAPLLEEVQLATALFDETLQGFRMGARVTGGDGRQVWLPPASGARSADILSRATALWEPWHLQMDLLRVAGPQSQAALLKDAADQARQKNLVLLKLMNELTTDLETAAANRANQLRMVQTGGIVLALLNFLFILFKFIRRLRRADEATEQASGETREILSVVREGLFLLTPDMTLGTQISVSVARIFGRPVRPGEHFIELLTPLVCAKTLDEACGYLDLLFAPHVREELVQSINPLTEVELTYVDSLGQQRTRFLALQFNRVVEGRKVRHLLVTLQDVSARVQLERKLVGEQRRAQREFDLLMSAFEADPAVLRGFIQRSESALLEVNDLLRQIEGSTAQRTLQRSIDRIARLVHGVKGEAHMLSLELLAVTAHQFETQLTTLRESPALSGDALLALPLPLEELLTRLQALKRSVLRDRTGKEAVSSSGDGLARHLQQLVQRIAVETGKTARLRARLDELEALPEPQRDSLVSIAVQLVRNAVVHGVETPAARADGGKPAEADIEVALVREPGDSVWQLQVSDDGAGIDVGRVRDRLLQLGWYTPVQLDEMSSNQIVAEVFKPGFSTADVAGPHAGRGVGLDLVMHEVRRLGARLLVSSRARQGSSFRVRLAG